MATVVNTTRRESNPPVNTQLATLFTQIARRRRLSDERSEIEKAIAESPDFDSALSAIETASPDVRTEFEPELLQRAQARFPEMELMPVLRDGNLAHITHEKGKPLSDDEIRALGAEPARHHIIVSTDKQGRVEVLDSAFGEQAAQEDLERLKETFPDRTFQIALGAEADIFTKIRDQQLEAERLATTRRGQDVQNRQISQAERALFARVQQEMANDPLATETGVTVLDDKEDDIIKRFQDFNGKFEGDVFSLENPESAALVQNGIVISSTAVARGEGLQEATDIGFNHQIMNSIVNGLLNNGAPDSAVAKEGVRRFGLDPQQLQRVLETMADQGVTEALPEYQPNNENTVGIFPTPVGNLRIVKIAGRIVILGKE